MEWRLFAMDLGSLQPERVEAIFDRHGAQAITLTDAGDEPVLEPAPGETPLWATTRITGLFSAEDDINALRDDLMRELDLARLPAHHVETLADRAWEREWLKDFRPMQFGRRLWVCPGGFTLDDAEAVVVTLDPGVAFGTGSHATTALCLEWLDGLELCNRSVLDYGCGSGILAIAALQLGAGRASAVDIDPQAIQACRQNALVNGVAENLVAMQDAGGIDGKFDIVLANILAGTLVDAARPLCERLAEGGHIALSGILEDQLDEVVDAYCPWIEFEPVASLDGWARLSGTRS